MTGNKKGPCPRCTKEMRKDNIKNHLRTCKEEGERQTRSPKKESPRPPRPPNPFSPPRSPNTMDHLRKRRMREHRK
jgi:hypothetical protein